VPVGDPGVARQMVRPDPNKPVGMDGTTAERRRQNSRRAPFDTAMTERDGPHSERFHDALPNTDPLGWVTERRPGRRYADLLFVDAERRLVIAKVSSDDLPLDAALTVSTLRAVLAVRARPGGLALAPNGREPGLLMSRPPRRAVVIVHLYEPGRGDVIAPGVKIEETGIATIAQAFLVVPPRI